MHSHRYCKVERKAGKATDLTERDSFPFEAIDRLNLSRQLVATDFKEWCVIQKFKCLAVGQSCTRSLRIIGISNHRSIKNCSEEVCFGNRDSPQTRLDRHISSAFDGLLY